MMSLNNSVTLVGFCASKPILKTSHKGTKMAVLVIYTQDYNKTTNETTSQAHRCLFFGRNAAHIVTHAEKGRHIHIRGAIRSQRKGEGNQTQYYTAILVEEFLVSPRQSVAAVKSLVRDILEKEQIKSCDELALFHGAD